MYSTVIGNGRTLQKDMVICGYRIPKGVSLISKFEIIITSKRNKSLKSFTVPNHVTIKYDEFIF